MIGTVAFVSAALALVGREELRRRANILIAETPVESRGEAAGRPIEAIALEVAARLTVQGRWNTRLGRRS